MHRVRGRAPTYQAPGLLLLIDMHMITPGIAASLTPTSVERPTSPGAAPRARRRLHVPQALLHVPHPRVQMPHRPA